MYNKDTSSIPYRILYTMIRVRNLEHSIAFYKNALGMNELRRETFTEGRFTLVFIGYDNGTSDIMIELTYNWDKSSYEHGSGYGHMAFEVADIYATCNHLENIGVKMIREPGPMTYAVDETGHKEDIAFFEDPDGYQIELIQRPTTPCNEQ